MASLQPTPLNATYGATKAFVTNFSESLHEEMRTSGVKVTAVLPGFTRTEFQERSGLSGNGGMPDFVWQSADECAAEAVAALAAGRAVVVPGSLNKAAAADAAYHAARTEAATRRSDGRPVRLRAGPLQVLDASGNAIPIPIASSSVGPAGISGDPLQLPDAVSGVDQAASARFRSHHERLVVALRLS